MPPSSRTRRGSLPDTIPLWSFLFFFQAEDGIRDKLVTGVQTCALPIYFVNAISTNLTRFFRESHHFEHFSRHVAAPFLAGAQRNGGRFRVWSAGCSTGEEIGRASCRASVRPLAATELAERKPRSLVVQA